MIKQFRVQNYKALHDVTLELTPLHVLIGPNDSGKSSILEAIAALCRSVDFPLTQSFPGLWEGSDLVWQGNPELAVTFSAQVTKNDQKLFDYHLSCSFLPNGRQTVVIEPRRSQRPRRKYYHGVRGCHSCQIIRWIPSLMRETFQLMRKPIEHPLSLRYVSN
jgi:predicted ATPase